jgi:hypothetical protein
MAKTFDFKKETIPINEYNFPAKASDQKMKASHYNVKRILKFRYATQLPQYIQLAAEEAGYSCVRIGYTTYRSSTWGFYKL